MSRQLHDVISNNKYNALSIYINYAGLPNDGFVFIYPSWSVTYNYLFPLLDTLVKFNYKEPIYIYDIDDNTCQAFLKSHEFISHGYGEIFYLIGGKVEKMLVHATSFSSYHSVGIASFVENIIVQVI